MKEAAIAIDRAHPTGLVDFKAGQYRGQVSGDGSGFIQANGPTGPVDQGQIFVPGQGQDAPTLLPALVPYGAEPGRIDRWGPALLDPFLDAGEVALLLDLFAKSLRTCLS